MTISSRRQPRQPRLHQPISLGKISGRLPHRGKRKKRKLELPNITNSEVKILGADHNKRRKS